MKQRWWAAIGFAATLAWLLPNSISVIAQQTSPSELPGCVYNATPPTISDRQSIVQQCDANGQLKINGSFNASTTAKATAVNPTYIEGSSNVLSQDLSGNLRITGSISATSNATATAAAPSYAEATPNAFSQNLTGDLRTIAKQSGSWTVGLTGAVPAGANVIGHVIADTGSTTAVTGNVTVVQPTGTNLHAVIDTGSTTAVTQATAANLNATVVGAGTAGAANANPVTVQGIAGMTKLLVTPDSVALPANQSVNEAQINGVTPLMGNGISGTGAQRVTIASDSTGQIALAAGSAVIGHVIADTGSTTAVTGNVTVVQPTGTNLHAVLDTTSTTAVTQATATNLNAAVVGTGTAGTPAGNILTVQGVASMTKLLVTPDSVALPANQSVNVAQINGITPLMGNGVTGTGSARVTIASDNTSNSNPFLINGNVTPADALALGTTSASTVARNSVYNGTTTDLMREVANSTNSTGTGIAAAGLVGQCDDTSPTALTENQFGNARIDCAQHSLLVTTIPSATAGGTTLYTLTLAATTNATNVKASAGQVYSISGFNISSATPVFISLYNNAGTPTCGTSIIQQFMIPGSTTGAGFVYDFATPKGFATGIAFCATTGIAGTGNPAATTYVLNIDYK